jgi:hypothetical protein
LTSGHLIKFKKKIQKKIFKKEEEEEETGVVVATPLGTKEPPPCGQRSLQVA